mmetsp:Transcript_1694/g.3102  ORF Transcript_1694/g.3102 Transcript_1694/m.3102 type:complete len:127 (-) Transcript_1694:32-412(-)
MPDWLQTSVRSSTLKAFLVAVAVARHATEVLRALLRRLATNTANTGVTAPTHALANENPSITEGCLELGCLELTPTLLARPFAQPLAGPAFRSVAKALPGGEEDGRKSGRANMRIVVHVNVLRELL